MRTKLGVLLVEEPDGKVGVQLFNEPADGKSKFVELNGNCADPKRRATYVAVAWSEGESGVEAMSLTFPRDVEKWEGWRLGSGPVKIEEPKKPWWKRLLRIQ